DDREAADEFLGFGEWTVGDGERAVGDFHAGAVLARSEAVGEQQSPGLRHFLDQVADGLHVRRRWRRVALVARLVNGHESHRFRSLYTDVEREAPESTRPGGGAWHRSLALELGRAWHRILPPEPGTGAWHRSLAPEPGTP